MKHSIKTLCASLAGMILFAGNNRAIGFYSGHASNALFSYISHQSLNKTHTGEARASVMGKWVLDLKKNSAHAKLVSTDKKSTLFKILRSKDANEILYDINLGKNGQLNTVNPIDVYWIKYTSQGRREPLNNIQRKYAYGLKFISIKRDEAVFKFVSYDKKTFVLRKASNGQFRVFVSSLGKPVELNKIFIQVDGGSFWFPKISRVELHGVDIMTGNQIIETINP